MSGSVEKVVIDLHAPIVNASKSREILEIQLRFLIICSFEFAGFLQSQNVPFSALAGAGMQAAIGAALDETAVAGAAGIFAAVDHHLAAR